MRNQPTLWCCDLWIRSLARILNLVQDTLDRCGTRQGIGLDAPHDRHLPVASTCTRHRRQGIRSVPVRSKGQVFHSDELSCILAADGFRLDGQVLVLHGGLFSKDETTLADVRKIQRHQEPPDEGPMTELLWSDPGPLRGKLQRLVFSDPAVSSVSLNWIC